MLSRISRRGLSGIPAARARVDGVDKGLVLLRPSQLQDTGRLKPGTIFRAGENGAVVALFKLRDAILGASLDGSKLEKGTVLEQQNDEELRLSEDPSKRVFDEPPRDMARQPITQSWFVNNPVVDLMTPIGVGQSMLFFPHAGSNLLNSIEQSLAGQNATIFFERHNPQGEYLKQQGGEDADLDACLQAFSALSRAEVHRDQNDKPVVVVVRDLTPFRRVWERAEALHRREKYEKTKDATYLGPDPAPDRTDLRHYYSTFIQRAARLKDSNKSLTLLLRVPIVKEHLHVVDPSKEFSLDEFEREVKAGVRGLDDFERLVRLRVKTGSKIKLTASNLAKLQIALPASAGGGVEAVREATQAKMHNEELMSIVDGHIVSSELFKDFCLDPRASLTRIGVGSNKNEITDTRPPLTRSLALGLRIEVADLYDSVHADPAKARHRLEAWKRALNLSSPLGLREDMGRFEAALVFAVRKNLFSSSSTPKFVLEEIAKLDLNKAFEEQVKQLNKCVVSSSSS